MRYNKAKFKSFYSQARSYVADRDKYLSTMGSLNKLTTLDTIWAKHFCIYTRDRYGYIGKFVTMVDLARTRVFNFHASRSPLVIWASFHLNTITDRQKEFIKKRLDSAYYTFQTPKKGRKDVRPMRYWCASVHSLGCIPDDPDSVIHTKGKGLEGFRDALESLSDLYNLSKRMIRELKQYGYSEFNESENDLYIAEIYEISEDEYLTDTQEF